MQTMTWTSPDTGVADRRRTASRVQRNVHLNNTNSLCPPPPGAPLAGRRDLLYHIETAIRNVHPAKHSGFCQATGRGPQGGRRPSSAAWGGVLSRPPDMF